MRKFAPIAMLMGLLTALLLGGTAAAQAGPALNYECNKGVNVVSCNEVNVGDVKVEIDHNDIRALTDNEIEVLEDNLNKVDVDILNPETTIKDIEVEVVKTYKSFNPTIIIDVDDVNVCVLAVCK